VRAHDRRHDDLQVRGRAPNIALARVQLGPGILERHVTLIASSPGSRRKRSYNCGDALDEQFETVSAQIAPGAFRSPEISLPHAIQIFIEGLTSLDCGVCHFCYGQAIENTGAAKH
jgi:hypothetical protein